MKHLLLTLSMLLVLAADNHLSAQVSAEDFLQIVSLEEHQGTLAVFTTAGIGTDRSEVEANATKSLIYALLFQGVEGIHEGKPLVKNENKTYTNSFFNRQARYKIYEAESQRIGRLEKVGDVYQGTFRVTIRIQQLINDVQKSTSNMLGVVGGKTNTAPKPTIMVVPYRREGEGYEAIIDHDFDKRVAISAVKDGFEKLGIKTIDLKGLIEAGKRGEQYDDNIGAASSNDKQLLLTSGADVYVIVELQKDVTTEGTRIALIMEARETSTGIIWASKRGWTNRFKTESTDQLCAYAVQDQLPDFLSLIEKNYAMPINATLKITVDGSSTATVFDECNNGKRIVDNVRNWLDHNAYQGDYNQRGEVAEEAWFDRIIIPRTDKEGLKMTTSKFANGLREHLSSLGVELDTATGVRIDGNSIMLTIM